MLSKAAAKRAQRPPAPLPDSAAALEPTPEFLSLTQELGIEFEPEDLPRLGRFLGLLLAANETTNLTAITDPAQAWTRHIFDALTLVPVLASLMPETESAGPVRVIDIGSGGGVPAIPLAIVLPDIRFTLVESTGKKAAFLRDVASLLGLSNVQVLASRAEPLGQDHVNHREKYDAAIARAVGHLAVVLELCAPLVRPGGIVVAVKGAKAPQELEESQHAMGQLGVRSVPTIDTPTGKLVVMEKTTRTPRLYPRRDGEPARLPLGVPKSS